MARMIAGIYDAQLAEIRECLARIETRLGFHRWAFALMITLQITILFRLFRSA